MYNNLLSIFEKRFSCRTFDENYVIPREDIEKILDGAFLGPSSLYLWPFELIAVDDKNTINLVANSIKEHAFIKNSSFLIIFCQRKEKYENINDDKLKNFYKEANEGHIDVSISGTYIDLISTSLGYNTIWMGCYENEVLRKVLNLPENLTLLYYISVGKNKFPTKVTKQDFGFAKDIKNKVHKLKYGEYYYDR